MKRFRELFVAVSVLWVAAGRFGSTPAEAGPPFITDDPEPVDLGHWELDFFSYGAAGRGDAGGLGPAMEINYGAVPNLQLHATLDFGYDKPADGPAVFGLSDTQLGVKYRILEPGDHDWFPEVAVYPSVELPTGNARRNLGAGYTQVFLPVWIQKDFGKWTTYGGGGLTTNPGPGNRNYYLLGWLLQRQVTQRLTVGAEVFHLSSSAVGQGETTGFSVGGTFDFSDHTHLLVSGGRGGLVYALNTAAIRDPFSYYLGFQWTF